MRHYLAIFVTVFLVVGLAGCAGMSGAPNLPNDSEAGAVPNPSVLVGEYKMGVGDEISVNVWQNPELSVQTPIRPDGKITMPLIGDVMAAGKEPKQLADDITKEVKRYVKHTNVTVLLTKIKGQEFLSRVRVTGAVEQDVSIEYQQGMTVLDAVLEAGSVNPYANGNGTKLHRKTEQGTATYDIRLKDIMEKGDMKTNVLLMPGDIISVPERFF